MEEIGLEMAAYYYNASQRWHNGRLEAVLNIKTTPPQRRMAVVDDVERGGKTYIETYPWQTDTCLGAWHYDRSIYDNDGYKSAATVIHTLCDVVSKNGNLLLNVPMRGDGTIDEKEERIVEGIAAWMGRYGDAIYGTRPWRVHGEGPGSAGGGMFSETQHSKNSAADIRYVRKGENLHAFVLGWPDDGVARLTLLANDNPIGEAAWSASPCSGIRRRWRSAAPTRRWKSRSRRVPARRSAWRWSCRARGWSRAASRWRDADPSPLRAWPGGEGLLKLNQGGGTYRSSRGGPGHPGPSVTGNDTGDLKTQ